MTYNIVFRPLVLICSLISKVYDKGVKGPLLKAALGACGKHVTFRYNEWHQPWGNVYLDNYTQLINATIISHGGSFIMKRGSGAAEGLVVITNNHKRVVGKWIRDVFDSRDFDFEKDIVVEEDVWIGSNVTLLGGCTIGRGAHVGTGSVIRNDIPPYAIVVGNPAKVIGFCMNPEDIVLHEQALYPESERLPIELLEKNYDKYFLKRLKEIKEYSKI